MAGAAICALRWNAEVRRASRSSRIVYTHGGRGVVRRVASSAVRREVTLSELE